MTNTERFADRFSKALLEALNHTEAGHKFTQDLLQNALAKNPDLTLEDWNEIRQQAMTAIFCGMCLEHKEFMTDLAEAVWDDLQALPDSPDDPT